jgi:hypothetical protein
MPVFNKDQLSKISASLRANIQHANLGLQDQLVAPLLNHAVTGNTEDIQKTLRQYTDQLDKSVPKDENGRAAGYYAAARLGDGTTVVSHTGGFKSEIENAMESASQNHTAANPNVANTRNSVNYSKGASLNGLNVDKNGFLNLSTNGPSGTPGNIHVGLGLAVRVSP